MRQSMPSITISTKKQRERFATLIEKGLAIPHVYESRMVFLKRLNGDTQACAVGLSLLGYFRGDYDKAVESLDSRCFRTVPAISSITRLHRRLVGEVESLHREGVTAETLIKALRAA